MNLLFAGFYFMEKFTIEQINDHKPLLSKLTAISFEGYRKYGSVNYSCVLCLCECGKQKICTVKDILKGGVKSCGCLTTNSGTHNLSGKHPLYHVWSDMKKRCYNKNCKAYRRYGGRGIKVCNKWINDFVCFYDWAINNGWTQGLEIDRINNNGNYSPKNCRFVTKEVNNNNKCTTIFIEYNNKKLLPKEWSELLGIPKGTILSRRRKGWNTENVLSAEYKNKIKK